MIVDCVVSCAMAYGRSLQSRLLAGSVKWFRKLSNEVIHNHLAVIGCAKGSFLLVRPNATENLHCYSSCCEWHERIP